MRISPHPTMTASAFFRSFRSLSFPCAIYFRRERIPFGTSVTKVIFEVSMVWLKNFFNRSGSYAAIVIFLSASCSNLTVHSKISSSPRFLYDRLPTMRMCLPGISNVLGMRIVPDEIKKDYFVYSSPSYVCKWNLFGCSCCRVCRCSGCDVGRARFPEFQCIEVIAICLLVLFEYRRYVLQRSASSGRHDLRIERCREYRFVIEGDILSYGREIERFL